MAAAKTRPARDEAGAALRAAFAMCGEVLQENEEEEEDEEEEEGEEEEEEEEEEGGGVLVSALAWGQGGKKEGQERKGGEQGEAIIRERVKGKAEGTWLSDSPDSMFNRRRIPPDPHPRAGIWGERAKEGGARALLATALGGGGGEGPSARAAATLLVSCVVRMAAESEEFARQVLLERVGEVSSFLSKAREAVEEAEASGKTTAWAIGCGPADMEEIELCLAQVMTREQG